MVAKSCRSCGVVCQGGLCQECRSEHERTRQRPSASRRGYDARYRANRLKVVEAAKRGEPCCICGLGFDPDELITAEHIVPLRQGGDNERSNLGPAHARCNFAWNRKFKP